ncbi:MAG: hypothetical protein VX855_04435, partial [Verrucomicrobiota bacterium]|nr:hypothetical protein [Verrucomicrobiota bacterium]
MNNRTLLTLHSMLLAFGFFYAPKFLSADGLEQNGLQSSSDDSSVQSADPQYDHGSVGEPHDDHASPDAGQDDHADHDHDDHSTAESLADYWP